MVKKMSILHYNGDGKKDVHPTLQCINGDGEKDVHPTLQWWWWKRCSSYYITMTIMLKTMMWVWVAPSLPTVHHGVTIQLVERPPPAPYLLPGETDLFNPSSWLFPGDYTEADDVEADYTEPDDDTDAADADADAGEADDVEADEDGGEADYTEADDADADNNNVD